MQVSTERTSDGLAARMIPALWLSRSFNRMCFPATQTSIGASLTRLLPELSMFSGCVNAGISVQAASTVAAHGRAWQE